MVVCKILCSLLDYLLHLQILHHNHHHRLRHNQMAVCKILCLPLDCHLHLHHHLHTKSVVLVRHIHHIHHLLHLHYKHLCNQIFHHNHHHHLIHNQLAVCKILCLLLDCHHHHHLHLHTKFVGLVHYILRIHLLDGCVQASLLTSGLPKPSPSSSSYQVCGPGPSHTPHSSSLASPLQTSLQSNSPSQSSSSFDT